MQVRDGDELGEGLVQGRDEGAGAPPLLGAVVVGVVADDHGVLHGNFHGPGLAAQLAQHLDDHLGGHGGQALGLVQDGGGDALAGGRLLQVGLLLDGRVVVALGQGSGQAKARRDKSCPCFVKPSYTRQGQS